MRPFDGSQVRQRMGPGRKALDYISGPDVIRRLLDATGNHFTWNVERVQLINQETPNGGSASLWIVQGTLTVDTLGSRSGVGTHPADSVEAAKAAETDALKRAAVKFGVGLHLYEDDGGNGSSGQASPPPQPSGGGYGNGNGAAYQRAAPGTTRSGNSGGGNSGGGYGGGRQNHAPTSYKEAAERDRLEGVTGVNGVGENAPF